MQRFYHLLLIVSVMLIGNSLAQKNQDKVKAADLTFDEICIRLIDGSLTWGPDIKDALDKNWETGNVTVLLEMQRLTRASFLPELYKIMEKKTGQKFGLPLPKYPEFKSLLYSHIDPRFADYFKNDAKSTIRLDEVVWGGVQKDGIPPLRNPKMLSAARATYLGDNDIVFGIEINGEARAYPKRILAWHEMFTDNIQGIPLAGVY